ncbi:pentatricopeptide repeat-containing protein At1g11290, chloroplastic-like [Selaginella moellendorffii]|uniref:pentatricopeptide repeat-containing protein At1g11290, chloroplastic-like n=1 Tax=Selaginella moellendorffii TaxID=88036 RepID=UPI000D1C5541|nr:pentatricopeptide repeat-containing protein At1g11290, chloroplastic-like [Selaginella moellendorffii]|eukprot:XP_024520121.1 pentatricopeptide repeat-containing protein At1g11290, chloroplastic-like [Selaginella moellendorffii]
MLQAGQLQTGCGSAEEARREFDRIATKNVVTWSAMLGAYARNGHSRQAVELYRRMVHEEKLEPSEVTYLGVVEACASLRSLDLGREIHRSIEAAGRLEIDAALGNALIGMYSKCRSCDDAWRVFESMKNKTVFSWNCMISAFTQQGQNRRALQLYHRMEPEGMKRNLVTFLSALTACSALQDLAQGKAIHARVADAGYDAQVVVRNALVHMYSKCGDLDAARDVFDNTVERSEVSWNSIMAAYAQNGRAAEALELYRKMDVQPDCITFTTALDACSRLRALDQGREIHQRLVSSGLMPDAATGNALITMYGRCCCLDEARAVFDAMEARDVVTWTAIIAAYSQSGDARQALEIYARMRAESSVKPNEITLVAIADACCAAKDLVQGRLVHSRAISSKFQIHGSLGNALVNMYASCGSLVEARKLFDEMRDHRDVICWSSMIAAYARHGHAAEALNLLSELCLEGVEPDHITFITILFACSHAGLVAEGRYVFALMVEDYCGCPDAQHYQCLVDVLGRAGWMPLAEELVKSMPFEPECAAWMTLLGSYNVCGDYQRGRQAAELGLC